MKSKISVFGLVAGCIMLAAYAALLAGVTESHLMQAPGGIDRGITDRWSPESFVLPGMALAAAVALISLISKTKFRSVGYIFLGYASLVLAGSALQLYSYKHFPSGIYIPVGITGYGWFGGIARMLALETPLEAIFGSIVSLLVGGVVTAALLAGALHACRYAANSTLPRILAGLMSFVIVAAMTGHFISVLQTTNLGEDYKMLYDLGPREQALGTYAGLMMLATLAVIVLSLLVLFAPGGAKKFSRAALVLLWGMAISLPVFIMGMLAWAGETADPAKYAGLADNWVRLEWFMAINGLLSILPVILLALGVSEALRAFGGAEMQLAPVPQESAENP